MWDDKIRGALVGACAGDALAAVTDGLTPEQTRTLYGGDVRDFLEPAEGSFSAGRGRARITDAFSIPYFLMQEIALNKGKVSRAIAENALRSWGVSEYAPFAGMTTKKVVNALNGAQTNDFWSYSGHLGNKLYKGHYYALSSNGAGCKAFPAGLLHSFDEGATLDAAMEICLSSHDDVLSVSGACAVALAMAACMEERASAFDVWNAACRGAHIGEQRARTCGGVWDYPGPSPYKRLKLAAQIAFRSRGEKAAASKLRNLIGCGPEVAETVPLATGLLIAYANQPLEALFAAVNIGDETCAVATLLGAFVGGMHGVSIFPAEWPLLLEEANGIDLESLAGEFTSLASS